MTQELSLWNDGKGISLKSWVEFTGNFKLLVGYSTIFWPKFVLYEDYILREGFNVESLRGFEKTSQSKASVEWVMNHLHLADIHCNDAENTSEDKIVYLGQTLKEVYETKLRSQFPDRPCIIDFYEPEDRSKLWEFQLSFWQKKHEIKN